MKAGMVSTLDRSARFDAIVEARRLGWLDGHSMRDIARALDINVSTVSRLLKRAREYQARYEHFLTQLENLK